MSRKRRNFWRALALAHHFDHLIQQGAVKDYAEIARLTQLSRARVAQIMMLKFLAPDIQERIALLPQSHGKDPLTEKQLRRIAMIPEWEVGEWEEWDRQQEMAARSRIDITRL